jgi:hypothetical protein
MHADPDPPFEIRQPVIILLTLAKPRLKINRQLHPALCARSMN